MTDFAASLVPVVDGEPAHEARVALVCEERPLLDRLASAREEVDVRDGRVFLVDPLKALRLIASLVGQIVDVELLQQVERVHGRGTVHRLAES